jgi:RNA polymerase sigma-70 factor, ECF subfamily
MEARSKSVSDGRVPRSLIVECRRGDRRAQEELVRRTSGRVYGLALRLTGDQHEAEDVAQEAYLRMFRALGGFREEASFETWMHRIVANVAFTHLRRRGRFGDLVAEDAPEPPSPERFDEVVLERDDLERALASLPRAQRIPMVMKDVYGMSVREIARELGITEGAVKVRLHRARRRMLELLSGAPAAVEQER